MKINHYLWLTLAATAILCSSSCSKPNDSDSTPALPSSKEMQRSFGQHDKEAFATPDRVHYPQTWFHYIGSNVSLEGITADLEAIAEAGISGVQLFHGQFGGKWPATDEGIAPLSENWDDAVRHTAEQARRLGLRFTMQNCPGWAMSGGPWIKPENAMRTIVSSRQDVEGGKIDILLQQPQPSKEEWRDYRDIAVIAFPTPEGDSGKPIELKKIKGDGDYPWEALMSGRTARHNFPPAVEGPHWVEVSFEQPTTVRTLELPSVQGMNHNMNYEPGITVVAYVTTTDGQQHKIVDAVLPQSNWQDNATMSFACPEVEGTVACRIELHNQHNMNLGQIKLYSAARKNSWESEAGWTLRSFERTADDVTQKSEAYIDREKIFDLTEQMEADGRLIWDAPEERVWTILRFGHVNEGKQNSPAPPEGTGWECDKLSTEGPEAHFAGYIGRLADGALQGGLLEGMLLDSWECSTQMWTMKMEQEFSERSGYALREWLPALMGYVVESPETTSRFLLDWRGVVGDLFANKFYRRMAELGHEKGLTVVYETAAGDVFPADIMEYFKYADIPMCEFWQPFSTGYVGSLNFKPIKPTASAAHLYGKPRVAAESFTSFALTWDEHLEMLKEYADYHFIEGVTHNVFHTYTHNPQIGFLPPGTSMGSYIGTPFLRGQTWWPYMREFTTYLARCSYMLERGLPVADVLWYLGDEISHKPDQGYPFPEGYRYDYCNPDVLLNRLSVKDGEITTPEGLTYSLIWIPENKRMLPETLERLYELIEQGATVVANAPEAIATLKGGKQAQVRFERAVEALWGKATSNNIINIGKGRLLSSCTLEQALQRLAIEPDVRGDVRWLHRELKGADWYFVTPKKQQAFSGKVEFHAEGAAELWDPVTGQTTPLNVERRGEYAVVELDMAKAGSCFVVFNHRGKQQSVEPMVWHTAQQIDSEWTVSFPEGWGAPTDLKTKELKPWCELISSDEGKAFSGKARYTTSFNVAAEQVGKSILLNLGKVDMIADVKVNGQRLRTLWCAPYSLEIGEVVKAGENSLEIDVVSTWYNRLVYDAARPEAERKTWTINGPSANAQLRESGLMGPVVLRY